MRVKNLGIPDLAAQQGDSGTSIDNSVHELKLQFKRLGGEGFTSENQELIRQVDKEIVGLDADNKTDNKKIVALQKNKTVLKKDANYENRRPYR